MYKVAYISGDNMNIASSLRQTIEGINQSNGSIVQIAQSQSSHQSGHTIVTITIIYTIR